MTVRVIGPKNPYEMGSIDTTSQSRTWSRGLSPFYVGPRPWDDVRGRAGVLDPEDGSRPGALDAAGDVRWKDGEAMKTEYTYVVQTRPARVRTPVWEDCSKPFKRHKDANDLAKSLTNVPSNRGHDDYYRVSRRSVQG